MSYASDALIDAQEREIKKLKAENAKLRKFANLDTEDIDTMSCLVDDLKSENASLKGAAQGLGELCDRYKTENDRLRELVKSAYGCVNRHVSCDACRMTCGGCTLQSAMRELGIEVE